MYYSKKLAQRKIMACSIPEPNSGCWIWMERLYRSGYGGTWRDGYVKAAHRTSYEAFKKSIPSGMLVCHSCDNPSCVNPDHLWLGTEKDNCQDMLRKGRRPKSTRKSIFDIDRIDI